MSLSFKPVGVTGSEREGGLALVITPSSDAFNNLQFLGKCSRK